MDTNRLLETLSSVRENWDQPLTYLPKNESYAQDIQKAREKTGWDESAKTGTLTISGRKIAFVAINPAFLGGSIGIATATRITEAIEKATALELPLLMLPAGGGTRMQEGTLAFLQMATITGAVMAHKAKNLPYLVYQRHPTMGGVFASWGSLGHVIMAQPGALVGFLGPRVYEAIYQDQFPEGVQLSENLQRLGIIDKVVAPEDLATYVTKILNVLLSRREHGLLPEAHPEDTAPLPSYLATTNPAEIPEHDAWESITKTRANQRLGTRSLLEYAEDVTLLSGTGGGENAPGLLLALARFNDSPCIFLGHCRSGENEFPLGPDALRQARRGIRLSRELRLPLVSVIDTQGAALSQEAEEGGLGGEIARCLSEILTHPTPTLSLLLGQGTGGMALASAPADRILACEHAWLAPLPPEGASAIKYRTTEYAAKMATQQGVAAKELLRNGIVDLVILEPTENPEDLAQHLHDVISHELRELMAIPRPERLAKRQQKFRRLGR